jgi:hypothetical protein
MDNKSLTLLPTNQLPQKALNEIKIAKQFNIIKEGDLFYYSKEFGLIKIFKPSIPSYQGIRLNKFKVPNKIKEINISVINPDNINCFSIDRFTDTYINSYMEELAQNFEISTKKELSFAYVSTDDLPGYKIIANSKEFEDKQGDLIYSKEYGVLFVQILDIHESNFKKLNGKWITGEEFRNEVAKDH